VPEKTIDISEQLVKNWLSSKETLKHAEAIKNSAENELLAAMCDAEAGIYSGGMITYFMQQSRTIDSRKLKEEKPDIAKEYEKVNKFRVLRNKETKIKNGKFEIDTVKFID
jgi:predicted phage-related endonuclease